MSNSSLPTRSEVLAAQERLAGAVHQTPVLTSRTLDALAGASLFFKCENFQRSGSFKIRGAMNAALLQAQGSSESGQSGSPGPLVTHSSGNHGAALALAGAEAGLEVVVVIPDNAPAIKKDNIARYGARLVFCGPTIADREAAVDLELAKGGHYVPPYNDARVIGGQGTIALEFQQQVAGLDELWIPVGGGGMASGCVLAVGEQMRVRGAEPELADDAWESLTTGVLRGPKPPITIADGLRGALGDITFGVLQNYGLEITRVSETQIVAAQQLLMGCLKIVVEPSGAVPLAAVLALAEQNKGTAPGKRLGLVISGGNFQIPLQDVPEDPAGLQLPQAD